MFFFEKGSKRWWFEVFAIAFAVAVKGVWYLIGK
jgi:hypothetical protein